MTIKPIVVWEDPKIGKTLVVDGHGRLEEALANGAKTVPITRINAETAEEAQAIGAIKNIIEGTASETDTAKFLKESGITTAELEGIRSAQQQDSGDEQAIPGKVQDAQPEAEDERVQGGGETPFRRKGVQGSKNPKNGDAETSETPLRRLKPPPFKFKGALSDKMRRAMEADA